MKISTCPLCQAVIILHPGKPPAEDTYFNRCGNRALNGKANRGKSHDYNFADSWRGVSRNSSGGFCSFPFTDRNGIPLHPLPLREYIEFTRNDFDVQELAKMIIELNQSIGLDVDISLIQMRQFF